jgi:DNA-binding NarL/FixJ family response regulator
MIQNIEWIKTQIRRLSLEGVSQEQIAKELSVGEGTVSAIMKELK